jgi:hypothetical protein
MTSGPSTFELNFGLTSVILGLALTHMASALRKLLLKGREVAWAPEPAILAFAILLIIVTTWMHQFSHNRGEFTDGEALLNVLRMLTLYFAAGFCLPEPEPGETSIDLAAYYARTRRFTYGSLVAGLLIFWVYNTIMTPAGWRMDLAYKALGISIWVVLMFVRWRWLNLLLLAIPLVGLTRDVWQALPGR